MTNPPSNPNPPSAPKLVVDSDWKAQAQAEKERLAAKEAQREADKAKAGPKIGSIGPGSGGSASSTSPSSKSGPRAAGPDGAELPEADFGTLVGTMITNCLMYMGAIPDPQTGRAVVSVEYARFHIDLLDVLIDKTKGNLTDEEQKDLTQASSELKLRFVELQKIVAEHMAKQAAQRMAAQSGLGQPGLNPGGGMNPGGPSSFKIPGMPNTF